MTHDEIIHRYLEGLLDGAETAEFNRLAAEDASFRTRLAQVSFDQAHLREIVKSAQPARRPATGRWFVAAAAAACLAIIATLVLRGPDGPRVLSGRAAIDGVESRRLTMNGKIVVIGNTPAELRLADGTVAELSPGSEASLRDDAFVLSRGSAHFKVASRLRLITPYAVITAGPSTFVTELRLSRTRPTAPPYALFIAVMGGSVELDGAAIPAGEDRLVTHELGAPAGTPYDSLLARTTITLDYAIELASSRVAGGLLTHAGLELDGAGGFSVEFTVGRRNHDVKLDVRDGTYVKTDVDDEDKSALGDAGMIPLRAAIARALKEVPGEAVDGELKIEDKKPFIDVKIVAGKKVHVVRLDGRSGSKVSEKILD